RVHGGARRGARARAGREPGGLPRPRRRRDAAAAAVDGAVPRGIPGLLRAGLPARVIQDGPTSILLLDQADERPSSIKLAGLGMRGLLAQAEQQRAGREALAYVDKRYVATGEPTPQCDVHALGLLLLRLVTGLPARWAKKAALEAAGGGRAWQQAVDASAGGWPTEVATEVALLGLRCCAMSDGRVACRPAGELLEEARTALEAMMDAAPGRTWS
ncbi:hypothetical protein CFC21_092755, partial [Triticum aestivum]